MTLPTTTTARIIAFHREQPNLTARELAEHIGCGRSDIYCVGRRHGLNIPKEPRRTLSPEARAKLRAAKLGRTYSLEHRAAISAGVLRTHPARARREQIMAALSDQERADFRNLTRSQRYSQSDALVAMGRVDLTPPSTGELA